MEKGIIKEALKESFYKGIESGTEFNEEVRKTKKNIAKRIRELRNEKQLTQANVADSIKINRVTYNGYENEKAEPNAEVLKRLAFFYDVSMDYLCCLTDNRFGRYTSEEKEEKANAEIENIQNQIEELQKRIESLK